MTLKETIKKIDSLQHLVGQKAPKWNSPILEIIPAPVNHKFTNYMQVYQKTGSIQKAIQKTKLRQFDILLIFSKGKGAFSFVYEWYSYFYITREKLPQENLLLNKSPVNSFKQKTKQL